MFNFIKSIIARLTADPKKDERIAELEALCRDLSATLVKTNQTLQIFWPEGSTNARWSIEHYNDVMGEQFGKAA